MGLFSKHVPQSTPKPSNDPEIPWAQTTYEHRNKDGSTSVYHGIRFHPGGQKRAYFLGFRKLEFLSNHGEASVAYMEQTGAASVDGMTLERIKFALPFLKAIAKAVK